jgi:hypothetical protein
MTRTKFTEILDARELLKVESLHKSLPARKRKILIYLASVIYILGLVYAIQINSDIQGGFLSSGFTLTILYVIALLLIFWYAQTVGPLIITERGIAFYPIAAEKWDDIEGYKWEEFKGYSWRDVKGMSRLPGPLTVFSSHEGICLRIINKGIIQRSLDGRSGKSIFATYLTFFSPEQIALAQEIFSQHGLKRLN